MPLGPISLRHKGDGPTQYVIPRAKRHRKRSADSKEVEAPIHRWLSGSFQKIAKALHRYGLC